MTNERVNFGGTLGEGETSKNNEDRPIEAAGQTNINSNEADRKRGEFIAQKIKEQAQASINVESQDKAICRVVNSWGEQTHQRGRKVPEERQHQVSLHRKETGSGSGSIRHGIGLPEKQVPRRRPKAS